MQRKIMWGKESLGSPPSVHVSEPSDFRLVAHVEYDGDQGNLKGIEEFMARATIPRGRRSPNNKASGPSLPLPPLRSLGEHFAQMASRESSPISTPSESPVRKSRLTPETARASAANRTTGYGAAIKSPLGVQRRLSPASKRQVSRPLRTKHEVHVVVDPTNPTGFAGLPKAWETILMYSGILPDEAAANPKAVIDVLNFSKTTDPALGERQQFRDSLLRTLPPIVLEDMEVPSMTSFDDDTDEAISRSDSYQQETPARALPSTPTANHARETDGMARFSPLADIENCVQPSSRSPSPRKDAQTCVVNELDSDYMESFIGAERRQNLPGAIPENLEAYFRQDDPHKLFKRMRHIGEGSCGNVYRAVDRDGRFVALKKVKPVNERDWKLYKFEAQVMQDYRDSENLVKCFDAFRSGNELWIVMEYVSAGTLSDLLLGKRMPKCNAQHHRPSASSSQAVLVEPLEESVIAYICREVLKGLKSLHSTSRVHRDIKGENVLLDMDGSVKVADFGFCAELSKQAGKRNTVVGTPFWMAPEVIRGCNYDCKIDIWSTGVLAFECAEGRPPHMGVSPIRAMFLIATQGAPALSNEQQWSSELRDFIGTCCTIKAVDRPSVHEALSHPFIAKACEQAYAAVFFGEALEQRT